MDRRPGTLLLQYLWSRISFFKSLKFIYPQQKNNSRYYWEVTRRPIGDHMGSTIGQLGDHLATTWGPLRENLGTTWRPFGDHLRPTWGTRGDHLGITWDLGTTWNPSWIATYIYGFAPHPLTWNNWCRKKLSCAVFRHNLYPILGDFFIFTSPEMVFHCPPSPLIILSEWGPSLLCAHLVTPV